MTLQAIDYDGFAAFLALKDRKTRTILRHRNCLRLISSQVGNLTKLEIDNLFVKLKSEGKKNSYLNTLVNAVRLYAQYQDLDSTLKDYSQFKKTSVEKATMSDSEIEAFLEMPRPKGTSAKDFQIWTVFFSICAFSGIRPGECANLKVADIDFGRQVFCIRDSKTNTPRVAPIAPNILPLVKSQVDCSTNYLFPSKLGGNKDGVTPVFDNVDWHYNFKKRIVILGIKRPHLSVYSLRHSYATRLLESNVSLFHVKKLMGHRDLKSTLVYEHLTTADLIQAVEKLPLVRKGTDPTNILQAITELIKSFHIEKDHRFTYSLNETNDSVSLVVTIKDLLSS